MSTSLRAIALAMLVLMPVAFGLAPASSVAADTEAALSLRVEDFVSTLRGPTIATAGLEGAPAQSVLHVHRGGDVGLATWNGDQLWVRPVRSFFDEWGIADVRGAGASIPLALEAGGPFDNASDQSFAMRDVTGDGVADVAVAHDLWAYQATSGPFPETFRYASVTLLDGSDGRTLWTAPFSGSVSRLSFLDELLVVGQTSGPWPASGMRVGFPGATSALRAYTFSPAGEGIDATLAWTRELPQWANVLALARLGDGELAAAWAYPPAAVESDALSRVERIDATDGAAVWSRAVDGWPRGLAYDATRDEVAVAQDTGVPIVASISIPQVVDEVPPIDIIVQEYESAHSFYALGRADGAQRIRIDLDGRLFRFLLVDLDGDAQPEWLATEEHHMAGTNARAVARDPATGETLWTHTIFATDAGLDPASVGQHQFASVAPGLAVMATPQGARVLMGSTGEVNDHRLDALDGATGALLWRDVDSLAVPLPIHLTVLLVDGEPAVAGATGYHELVAFRLADGERIRRVPLLNDLHAFDAADVTGDAVADVIAGSFSGGVFAFDGQALGHAPTRLWSHPVSGPVHQLDIVDLDADGAKEVVVASSRTRHEQINTDGGYTAGLWSTFKVGAIDVLDARTGALRHRTEIPEAYVWSYTLVDADGDGTLDIIVPQADVTAIDGADGSVLWRYQPFPQAYVSNLVTVDGLVLGQWFPYVLQTPEAMKDMVPVGFDQLATHQVTQFALDAATGAPVWERAIVERGTHGLLWRAVASGARTADGANDGVAFAYGRYLEENGNPERPTSAPVVDVLDPRTGALLHGDGIRPDVRLHGGLEVLPSMDVVQYQRLWDWRCISPEGVALGSPVTSGDDIAEAHFGPLGRAVLVATWTGALDALDPGTTCGQVGARPAMRASLSDMESGALRVKDLDGDGIDEVMVGPHDVGADMTLAGRAQNTFGMIGSGAVGTGALRIVAASG